MSRGRGCPRGPLHTRELTLFGLVTASGETPPTPPRCTARCVSPQGRRGPHGDVLRRGHPAFAYLLLRGRMIPVPLARLGVVASAVLVVGLPPQSRMTAWPDHVADLAADAGVRGATGLWLLTRGVVDNRDRINLDQVSGLDSVATPTRVLPVVSGSMYPSVIDWPLVVGREGERGAYSADPGSRSSGGRRATTAGLWRKRKRHYTATSRSRVCRSEAGSPPSRPARRSPCTHGGLSVALRRCGFRRGPHRAHSASAGAPIRLRVSGPARRPTAQAPNRRLQVPSGSPPLVETSTHAPPLGGASAGNRGVRRQLLAR